MKKKTVRFFCFLITADLLLALLLNVFACLYADSDVQKRFDSAAGYVSRALAKSERKTEPGHEEENTRNLAHYFLNQCSVTTPFLAAHFVLFDAQSGIVLCESDDTLFLIAQDSRDGDGDDRIQYVCRVLNEDELSEYVRRYQKSPVSTVYRVDAISRNALECYVTDMTFGFEENGEPVELHFTREHGEPGWQTETAGGTVKLLSPVPTRWDLLGYPEEKWNWAELYHGLCTRNREAGAGYTAQGLSGLPEKVGKDQFFYFMPDGDSTRAYRQSVTGADGRELVLFGCYTFNVRQMTFPFVLGVWIAGDLIAAAVFFLRRRGGKRAKRA